jgi:heterodisulfide reductase subunit C2
MATLTETHIVGLDSVRYSFADEIMKEPGGEHLFTCSQCGTCTGICPISRLYAEFNPRRLLMMAAMGMREEVLSSSELWQCSACDVCYSRCPHQVHISEVMVAIRNIALREGYERPGPVAAVNLSQCTACGRCVAACPYQAVNLQLVTVNRREKWAAQVERDLCAGCGICNSVCPSSSIAVIGHSDQEIHDSLVAGTHTLSDVSKAPSLKIKAMVCQWCLYSRPDVEFAASPPEGVEIVRIPCAGRVSAPMVLTALQRGTDAVLIVGCKREECHYIRGSCLEGNHQAMLAGLLEMLGIDRRRVHFARIGSLDRRKFERLVKETIRNIPNQAEKVG